MEEKLRYRIAINLVPGIGPKMAKLLIAHCGGAEAVFREKKQTLKKVFGVGDKTAGSFTGREVFDRADKEIDFIEKNNIRPLYFLDIAYPKRLKMCEDGPVMLYYQGNADLNKRQIISIVGTRSATEYGKDFCESFIHDLKPYNPLIVSGLAYGIDVWAHRQSLQCGIPTVGVLGHGLDRIYPASNKRVASRMPENGGLLTEFTSETNPDRENFPKRNRIVAGMSDAVIVVEAARKGGALITAEIANSYNREVFAVPGNLKSTFSEGCNYLIKTHKASLITGVEDLKYLLGWEEFYKEKAENSQMEIFPELKGPQKAIFKVLKDHQDHLELDSICLKLEEPVSRVLQNLMDMELKGIVKSLPGRVYSLI